MVDVVAEPRDRRLQLDLVVEAGRAAVADAGLSDDHVHVEVEHRLVGAHRLAVELGHREVEVRQVVGVEDDPLLVALGPANAHAMPEGSAHRSQPSAAAAPSPVQAILQETAPSIRPPP